MTGRVYLSNIAPGWDIERQEKLLDEKLPGWRKLPTMRDILGVLHRRRKNLVALVERERLLRPGTRKTVVPIHLAALPVIAFPGDDFLGVLAALDAGGYALIAYDTGTEIRPHGDEAARAAAVAEFTTRRRKGSEEASRTAGMKAATAKRRARVIEGCARIADQWKLPSAEARTKDLLALAGKPGKPLAYNSAVSQLGGREKVQMRYQAELKRKAKRKEAQKK